MKENKFRAWHKPSKKMFEVLELNSKGASKLTNNKKTTNVCITCRNLPCYNPYVWESDAIVMAYSGLEDKNKKEIYESDILLIPDFYTDKILDDGSGPEEPFNHLAPVIFQDGSYGLNILESGDIFKQRFYSFIELMREGYTEFEIIGNVYQNSELLK